ncbi:unnamed protein product [Clonostachys rosea]|uniref:C2H2-type domain-containing protein n=1 Tax=Bionectria ochroleuca TaxID=29856 RepID=A0ABY6UKP6_BIOOC|nr:unnamed protein product [Clonostachys rosea]
MDKSSMSSPPIDVIALNINKIISGIVTVAKEKHDDLSQLKHDLAETLEDELGRFRVWSGNLGAFHEPTSPSSLEHRLRDGPKMKESIITGLQRLEDVSQRVNEIITGTRPNASDPIADSECRDLFPEHSSPLEELLMGLHSSISNLFSLAMLIRRDRPKGRRLDARRLVLVDKTADITYVEDRFPKLRQKPWLAQRLGEAISYRREFIRYRQAHRQKLQTRSDLYTSNEDSKTLATTFKEVDWNGGQNVPSSQGNVMEPVNRIREDKSIFSAGTSYVSAETTTSELRIPDLSNMILDGIRLDYGQHIECPYCRTVQQPLDRHTWKKHVFQDLEPYVCLFEDCSFKLFETRREWYEHETTFHGRHWSCRFCSTSNRAIYGKESEMVDHIKLKHAANMTELQIPLLLQACEQKKNTLDTRECPFCSEWKADRNAETMKGYYRHISGHLQPMALASIPLVIEGLEIINEDESKLKGKISGREERVAIQTPNSSDMTDIMNFVMKPFQEIQATARRVINNLEKSHVSNRNNELRKADLALETEGRAVLQSIEPLCVNLLHEHGSKFVDALTQEIARHRVAIHKIIWDFDYVEPGPSGVDAFVTLQKRSNNALLGIMGAMEKINAKFEEEKFDLQKSKIIESCFSSGSESGGSYIHHIALLDGFMLCVHVSETGEIRLSRLLPDDESGGFQDDMTWDFEKIGAIRGSVGVPSTEFGIEIDGLWHVWMTTSHEANISFIARCVSVFQSYSGGRSPLLLGFASDEMDQILGKKQRDSF